MYGVFYDQNKRKVSGISFLLYLGSYKVLQHPGPGGVEGGELEDYIIGNCSVASPGCKKIGFNVDKWFENLKPELQVGLAKRHKTNDVAKIEEEYQKLKDNFPNSEPFVLTHGDLDFSNNLVKGIYTT
jgi:hypothetical protein